MNRVLIAVLGGLLLAATNASAQHQHSMPSSQMPTSVPADALANAATTLKVSKKGDVNFNTVTLVGTLRLKPGHYRLQHRTEGVDHFVRFTEVTKAGATVADAGEVRCALEPADRQASATVVQTRSEAGAEIVTKVLIRGENFAHVF